jgi:hypothetical protein
MQPLGSALPLAGNRGAVAKHHKPIQPLFLMQAAKAHQGPQGFAGPGPCVNQHIGTLGRGLVEARRLPMDLEQPGAQQLNQLALPLAGLDAMGWQGIGMEGRWAQAGGGPAP